LEAKIDVVIGLSRVIDTLSEGFRSAAFDRFVFEVTVTVEQFKLSRPGHRGGSGRPVGENLGRGGHTAHDVMS
jgi:hypothetical protein